MEREAIDAHRSAVVEGGRHLLAAGLVRGTSGNLSVRAGDLIAVSPTGLAYPDLVPADIAVIELATGIQRSGRQPTSELQLHLAIYRNRPDVAAVVHTHSIFATSYASVGRPIPPVHYLIARASRTGLIRTASYARYGSTELAEGCLRALGDDAAVLLANHGVVTAGASLAAALTAAEAVEYVAELAWRAEQLGDLALLTPEQLAEAAAAFADYGQPDNPDQG